MTDADAAGLDRATWRALVDDASPPTRGGVVDALVRADDTLAPVDDHDAAERAVETALADGVLVETDDGGVWGTHLAVGGGDGETEPVGTVDTNGRSDTGEDTSETAPDGRPTPEAARAALADAVEWFHARLDDTIPDHADGGEHPDRPTTAREYFEDVRGFDTETVAEARLGWAPADADGRLVEFLYRRGHDRDAIRGTGLFTEDLRPLWNGRYVFPYFDRDGDAAYAIGRCTGAEGGGGAGYDGHPEDFLAGKYAKLAHTKDYVPDALAEPIFGLRTLARDGPVLITEGVADAIRAHEAGYACLSPVTTQFKQEHREQLADILADRDRRVYVVQDSERAETGVADGADGWDGLDVQQYGPGLKGAVRTAAHLRETGVDAYLAELPRLGLAKVDLDDYLGGWADTLSPVLRSARPASAHPAYQSAPNGSDGDGGGGDDGDSDGDWEDLAEGVIKEALSHVSQSLAYDDWIQLGFAVLNWDDGPRGKRVFKSWSKQSHKWEDPTSGDAVDWIWENGSEGGGGNSATVATLFERAFRGGWIPDANTDGFDRTPYRAVVTAAERFDVCGRDEFVRRREDTHAVVEDRDDVPAGVDTYRALPDAETYDETLDALEANGYDHGREYHDTDGRRRAEDAPDDPLAADVAVEPRRAWRADTALAPDDLAVDDDPDAPVPAADGDAWRCPDCGAAVDGAVRAAALAAGDLDTCDAPLDAGTYSRHYRRLRAEYDAPLPEYVSRETRTERWDLVVGALDALGYEHLDAGAMRSEIVAAGSDAGRDKRFRLNPSWRESESGDRDDDRASVVWYHGGPVYEAHPDVEAGLPPLAFVALDSGAVPFEEFADAASPYDVLSGETFRHVYALAREEYGAPLPEYYGTDPEYAVVLPDAEDLRAALADRRAEADADREARLDAARDETESLYREAAGETGTFTLHRALPGLGKSRAVPENAREHPALYCATRRELRAEAADRARDLGLDWMHLPVFGGEATPGEEFREAAEAVLREHGTAILRQGGRTVRRLVEKRLGGGVTIPEADDDAVDLDAATCETAAGEHGLGWWVRVHAARARGYRPQQIHQQADHLFGTDLPCACDHGGGDGEGDDGDDGDDDSCPYTAAWDRVSDPDRPLDLLIGHPVHAHVPSARTHFDRDGNNRVSTRPRTVVFDEFPGDVFDREFGDEYRDYAAWLAGAVAEDVADREDMTRRAADLWADDAVRAWLRGELEDLGDDATLPTLRGALGTVADALGARETVEYYRGLVAGDLELPAVADRLADHGVVDRPRDDAADDLAAVEDRLADYDVPPKAAEDLRGAVETFRALLGRTAALTDGTTDDHAPTAVGRLRAAVDAADRVAGPLRRLVADAFDAATDAADPEDREDARGFVRAAHTALGGGREGVETLAVHDDDRYAHPLADALLYAALAPAETAAPDLATTVECEGFDFDGRADGETTRVKSVRMGRDGKTRILADRDEQGAVVRRPPATGDAPVVGLDATARPRLWSLVLGRDDPTVVDPHDSMTDRREFLHDVVGLRVVQTTGDAKAYGGDVSGTAFGGDVALVDEAADYPGHDDPAVVTTKAVEGIVGDDFLAAGAASVDHYGDLRGTNDLAERDLLAVLGYQHHGDDVVEKTAAFAGEAVDRAGHGMGLEYGSDAADAALRHMREDSVMQAMLRAGRTPDVDPLVLAHTAGLRDDVPVVAEGVEIEAWSTATRRVADVAVGFGRRFTAADVRERLLDRHGEDAPSARTVRRALARLAEAGYLDRDDPGAGRANRYRAVDDPGTGEVDLPTAVGEDPDDSPLEVFYTRSVRVSPGPPRPAGYGTGGSGPIVAKPATLPAPDTATAAAGGDRPPDDIA